MLIEDTMTESSCMADYFSKFFDAVTAKYTLKPIGKNISSKFHYGKDRGYTGIDSFARLRGYRALSISILKRCVSIFGISSQMLCFIIV